MMLSLNFCLSNNNGAPGSIYYSVYFALLNENLNDFRQRTRFRLRPALEVFLLEFSQNLVLTGLLVERNRAIFATSFHC